MQLDNKLFQSVCINNSFNSNLYGEQDVGKQDVELSQMLEYDSDGPLLEFAACETWYTS